MLSCSKPCAARREDGCFAELTWNILDDLPILDGRSHLGMWYAIVLTSTQSRMLIVTQARKSIVGAEIEGRSRW
jgi:hypothetical protein